MEPSPETRIPNCLRYDATQLKQLAAVGGGTDQEDNSFYFAGIGSGSLRERLYLYRASRETAGSNTRIPADKSHGGRHSMPWHRNGAGGFKTSSKSAGSMDNCVGRHSGETAGSQNIVYGRRHLERKCKWYKLQLVK